MAENARRHRIASALRGPTGRRPGSSYRADTLLLYSDGVIEAENAAGEPFSEERLLTLIAQHAVDPSEFLLDTIVACALQWSDAKTPNDDTSALWIRHVQ